MRGMQLCGGLMDIVMLRSISVFLNLLPTLTFISSIKILKANQQFILRENFSDQK